ncbi:hypothetical protein GGR57DRAFT_337017 [Xylariaceae sp. FL1272]|nr:hypothetical protein GGR57DRAFT_337017 [Xylariaceae sp. FL1272]
MQRQQVLGEIKRIMFLHPAACNLVFSCMLHAQVDTCYDAIGSLSFPVSNSRLSAASFGEANGHLGLVTWRAWDSRCAQDPERNKVDPARLQCHNNTQCLQAACRRSKASYLRVLSSLALAHAGGDADLKGWGKSGQHRSIGNSLRPGLLVVSNIISTSGQPHQAMRPVGPGRESNPRHAGGSQYTWPKRNQRYSRTGSHYHIKEVDER